MAFLNLNTKNKFKPKILLARNWDANPGVDFIAGEKSNTFFEDWTKL